MQHCEGAGFAAALSPINEPRASGAQNPSLDAQKRANRGCPKTNQVFRIGEVDLSLNKRQTRLGLLRRRSPVARRPPRNDIGDIDLLPIESDCVQHAVQQLPRSSDKRAPDSIFVPSRSLADKHDP